MIKFKLFEQTDDDFYDIDEEMNNFFCNVNCKIISTNMTEQMIDDKGYKTVLVCYEEIND